VALENLHITLAFLGSVDDNMYQCVHSLANEIEAESFAMTLSRLGFFPRPRVIWLGPESCPPALQYLVQVLNLNLSLCGYVPESRPYHPHLTLFRKALPVKSEVRVASLRWSIDSFCLVESKTHPHGVEYCVLRHYSLLS
jgi:2'-5' RNA ligase